MNGIERRKTTFSYLQQFRQKYAGEFEKESQQKHLMIEQKVDEEVKRLYAEFEVHKKLRDSQNSSGSCSIKNNHQKRPTSRLLKSKFTNHKLSSYFVAPSRVDSIQNGCNQVKEKQNLLKKRIEYGKKVTQIHSTIAHDANNRKNGKSLSSSDQCGGGGSNNNKATSNKITSPSSSTISRQPAEGTFAVQTKKFSSHNSSCWDSKMLLPPPQLTPSSQRSTRSQSSISKEHCCNNKILMKNPQFMTAKSKYKQSQLSKCEKSTTTDDDDGNMNVASSTKKKIKSHRTSNLSVKSTGSSLDYGKFDEINLEEMRMRHELAMQYVNKMIEEMKL